MRAAKLKALGNAVVPQCAEIVGLAINAIEAGHFPNGESNGRQDEDRMGGCGARGVSIVRAGIALDRWKLEIFERHLRDGGYAWENAGELPGGCLLLTVETENVETLGVVVKAANDEAARVRPQSH